MPFLSSFSDQSEVATDRRQKKIVNNEEGNYCRKNDNVSREKNSNSQSDNKDDSKSYPAIQSNRPPLFVELLKDSALGISGMAAGYIVCLLKIDYISIGNFLLYVVNPGLIAGASNNSPIFGALLLFWSGLAVIEVRGISKAWPRSVVVALAVFIAVLVPVFLAWHTWPFSFFDKAGWTACYLLMLWYIFYVSF